MMVLCELRDNQAMEDSRAHWQRIFTDREPEEVSWFEEMPKTSIELIEEAAPPLDAGILDVGGGTSRLAGQLVTAGYTDVTVADISNTALQRARAELGAEANTVKWIEADVRDHDFGRTFDLWHDRAVFHFMVQTADRDRYLAVLRRTLRPGGHLILATFGPGGPTQCSGLPVARYTPDELVPTVGQEFLPVSFRTVQHHTSAGRSQEFLYAHLRCPA